MLQVFAHDQLERSKTVNNRHNCIVIHKSSKWLAVEQHIIESMLAQDQS